MLVGDLKERVTYREFLEWLVFLNNEEERQTKQDYYLAQIAAEIRRGQVTNPRSVKVKDFLVEMTTTPKQKKKMERSKSFWLGMVNVKQKGS
jgi:hypothetical protein